MDVDVLGPVQASVRGRPVELAGRQRRTLLAALAVRVGEVVPISWLVDAMWDTDPPASAVVKVQGHISALRQAIEAAGHPDPRSVVITRSPGYLLDLGSGRLDAALFEALRRDAERWRHEGRLAETSDALAQALALWRGPAFADVATRTIQAEATQLEERRLITVQTKAEADLALGRYATVVSELGPLVAAHPLREGLRAQLMLALYRSGRQADALDVYRRGRRILVDELGIEPGPELRRLEAQILTGRPAAPAPAPVPALCDLPGDHPHFTGREREVERLLCLLARPAAGLVCNITGAAGIGKTALAVHVAHRVRDRFPDGRLYVDLRSAEHTPVQPAEALGRFLRALGVPGHAIPDGEQARADLYRALVADRQVLVVLDNAASEQQVRPLLPGGRRCATLVTSRRALSGLELTALLTVGGLAEPAAGRLFAVVAGLPDATPDDLDRVVRYCGRLPLAIRIAAARLAARPHWTVTDLADRLADERHRLHELAAGDLDVRASLALSYENLGEPARRAFRLLALVGDAPVGAWRLAALLDCSPAEADRVLERLVELHLLEPHERDTGGAWTYRMHDLVRLYATELLAADPLQARTDALRRLLASQLVLAEAAEDRLLGPIPCLGRGPAPRREVDPELRRRLLADPLAWFETERRSLVAGVEAAAAAGMGALAANLACAMIGFLLVRVYWSDAHRVLQVAMRCRPDPLMAAHLRRARVELAAHRGDPKPVLRSLGAIAEQLGSLGDQRAECYTRWSLADTLRSQCRFDEAREQLDLALAGARRLADRRAEGMALCTMAQLRDMTGDSRGALELYEPGLALLRAEGDLRSECYVQRLIGVTLRRLGDLPAAIDRLVQARELSRALRDDRACAVVTNALALALLGAGDTAGARRLFDEILGDIERLAVLPVEAIALRGRAECDLQDGNIDAAIAGLRRSLVELRQLGLRREVGMVLQRLGEAYRAAGDEKRAQDSLLTAIETFTELGLPPEAHRVAALLQKTR